MAPRKPVNRSARSLKNSWFLRGSRVQLQAAQGAGMRAAGRTIRGAANLADAIGARKASNSLWNKGTRLVQRGEARARMYERAIRLPGHRGPNVLKIPKPNKVNERPAIERRRKNPGLFEVPPKARPRKQS